jgi:lipopolysaccharide export system protein LptA
MNRALALLPLAGTLALTVSTIAEAQQRHDSNAPIDFAAQHIEIQDKANRALLTGNVVIKQAEMTMTAPRVNVLYTGSITNGSPEVSRMDASGGVTVNRPDQSARGQYGVYDVSRHVITMIGAVTLTQNTNIVHGSRLSINLDTGRATIDGSGVPSGSATAPGTTQSSGGRVTGRFSVPKRNN